MPYVHVPPVSPALTRKQRKLCTTGASESPRHEGQTYVCSKARCVLSPPGPRLSLCCHCRFGGDGRLLRRVPLHAVAAAPHYCFSSCRLLNGCCGATQIILLLDWLAMWIGLRGSQPQAGADRPSHADATNNQDRTLEGLSNPVPLPSHTIDRSIAVLFRFVSPTIIELW